MLAPHGREQPPTTKERASSARTRFPAKAAYQQLGLTHRVSPSSSARLREAQVDLRGRRIRPARRDDLAARVEVDPPRPVDVRVAEEGVLPPAEGVVRN